VIGYRTRSDVRNNFKNSMYLLQFPTTQTQILSENTNICDLCRRSQTCYHCHLQLYSIANNTARTDKLSMTPLSNVRLFTEPNITKLISALRYYTWIFYVLSVSVALVMRRIILPSVTCLTLPFFPTFFYKGHDFGGKKNCWIQNVCSDCLYKFHLKHFSF